MQTKCLSKLSVNPIGYQTDIYDAADFDQYYDPDSEGKKHPQMWRNERLFVNGLIRYFKPKNILEIGVNIGEGSATILNAAKDYGAKLTSIDKAVNCVYEPEKPIGYFVGDVKCLPHDNWQLVRGKDPCEVIDELPQSKEKYDMLVLDTLHAHPVESLNFLSVLPYLCDGAVVILHDILLFQATRDGGLTACTDLWSSVTAEKLRPDLALNIGAFQISEDTRKYIGNVFDGLVRPWEVSPDDIDAGIVFRQIDSLGYADADVDKLKFALMMNKSWWISGKSSWWDFFYLYQKRKLFDAMLSHCTKETIFYGGGTYMRQLLEYCRFLCLPLENPIWDAAYSRKNAVCGHLVSAPDFETKVTGRDVIITMRNPREIQKTKENLQALGYTAFSFEKIIGEIERAEGN